MRVKDEVENVSLNLPSSEGGERRSKLGVSNLI